MLIIKNGKQQMTEGILRPNQGKLRKLGEEEKYKYLGILEADTIKQADIKEKKLKEYFRRTRKLLETKVYWRNLIKEINTWAIPTGIYSRSFLNWTREELQQMDQRTRKLMTKHKNLHLRYDVESLHISRKEGGRGIASIKDSVDISIRRIHKKVQRKTDYSD